MGRTRHFLWPRCRPVRGGIVTYSYSQISQYLSCPRRYKHRYLDGWKETDTRAAMIFGRAFELAIAAYFQQEDAAAVLYREWAGHRESRLYYSQRESWDRMLQFGVQLLERFAQDDRVRIREPRGNLQVKFLKSLTGQNDFVAHVDAIGELDGKRCLLEWKTTASRYPEEPTGLLALDPQLICYSWVTGIAEVAQIVFVRKRLVEIQYFRTIITDEQREEFGHLVQNSHSPDRIGRFSTPERNPLSPESLHQLSLYRALPGKAGFSRIQAGATSRSRRPWLA